MLKTTFINFTTLFLVINLSVACVTKNVSWDNDYKIKSVKYKSNNPPSITLLTMINNTTGIGGHSALLINADERILFDPAGTFVHPQIPERHDVLFGINDEALEKYVDYHARPSIHVVMQQIEVDLELAKNISKKVQNYGPVQDMMCSYAITEILSHYSLFETIPKTIFPKNTMKSFTELSLSKTSIIYDYFEDDTTNVFFENQTKKK